MKASTAVLSLACCLVASLPLAQAWAGSDSQPLEPRFGAAAAAAEFDAYLHMQKVNHRIDLADDKGAPQGPLTVKIYSEMSSGQQNALCGAMSSMARRTGTRTSTVQFFALEQGTTAVSFQASRLPSGNGDVTVNRLASAPAYRLVRTARL